MSPLVQSDPVQSIPDQHSHSHAQQKHSQAATIHGHEFRIKISVSKIRNPNF
jgi:6-pyruvoyl-tetrahydropterin synthase